MVSPPKTSPGGQKHCWADSGLPLLKTKFYAYPSGEEKVDFKGAKSSTAVVWIKASSLKFQSNTGGPAERPTRPEASGWLAIYGFFGLPVRMKFEAERKPCRRFRAFARCRLMKCYGWGLHCTNVIFSFRDSNQFDFGRILSSHQMTFLRISSKSVRWPRFPDPFFQI